MPTRHRRGRWRGNQSTSSDEEHPQNGKYCPKHKHGKPVGRREILEKYKALGDWALERDIKGGIEYPQPRWWLSKDIILNRRHFAIVVRVHGYQSRWEDYWGEPSRKILRRRAAKDAARDELQDFEGFE